MNTKSFLLQLLLVSAMTALGVWGLHQIEVLLPYSRLSWMSIGGFIAFSLLLFWLGKKSAKSANNQLFTQIFLVATAFKMVLCIALVWWYFKAFSPESHLFIIPFFLIYAIYTSFEIHFLGKLAKT